MHMVEEVIKEMEVQASLSCWVFNPLAGSCSVDEDFVGRTAFICRHVSPRLACQRSLERYLVQLWQVWSVDL